MGAAGRRSGRVCAALIVVLAASLWLAGSAFASTTIYWGNYGNSTISFAAINGSGGGQLTPATAPANPLGLAIDTAKGRLLWADAGSNHIGFTRLSGSGGGDLPTTNATVATPVGLAIDPSARRVYWANSADDTIDFASLDFSGGGQLNTGAADLSTPSGVVVVPAKGKIYWTNRGANTIDYANLDGSGGGGLALSAPVDRPIGLALDPKTNTLYWANNGNNTIGFATLNGNSSGYIPSVSAQINGPAGLAVNPVTGTVYWANNSGNSIAFFVTRGPHMGRSGQVRHPGATLNEPSFPILLSPPSPGVPPTISGGSKVGATLHCSTGGWLPDSPASFFYRAPTKFTYLWTRDGTPIGNNSPKIVTPAAGRYVCHLTAANQAGEVRRKSAPHQVSAG